MNEFPLIVSVQSTGPVRKARDGFEIQVIFTNEHGVNGTYTVFARRKRDIAGNLIDYQTMAATGRLRARINNNKVIADSIR